MIIYKRHEKILSPASEDFVFIFNRHEIILLDGKTIPQWADLVDYMQEERSIYCFAASCNHQYLIIEDDLVLESNQFRKVPFKQAFSLLTEDVFALAKQASHLIHWRKTHIYCGACGGINVDKKDEQALVCSACNQITYPRISPSIIVLIHDGPRLLLARSPHFPPGIYSAIAGFVEPGETLEQTVHREIMEEVGVRVHNLQYFASQPWPFPDTLMIGFMAEYLDGEIKIDQQEIEDAQWFSLDELPIFSSKASISRHLIDAYVEKYTKKQMR